MKATLYSPTGEKKSQVELPKVFETPIREDIVSKYHEAFKWAAKQPYSSAPRAGLRQSAAGTISHKRHDWKGHYGKGISRAPRKTMWRRGTQFYWVGATVPGARGGRKAHAPKGYIENKKINRKEVKLAFSSAFASTAHLELIKQRYSTMEKISEAPFVIESLPQKTKSLNGVISKIFSNHESLAFKEKKVRAGKGKSRGRKYKSNAGVLIVVAKDENKTFKGFNIVPVAEVKISDLYPLGRLTLYTQKALLELGGKTK